MFKYLIILALLTQGSSFMYTPESEEHIVKGYPVLPYFVPRDFDVRVSFRTRYYWKMKTSAIARGKPYFKGGFYWFAFLDEDEGHYAILAKPEQKECLMKCWKKYDFMEMVVFSEGDFFDDAIIKGLRRWAMVRIDKFLSPCK